MLFVTCEEVHGAVSGFFWVFRMAHTKSKDHIQVVDSMVREQLIYNRRKQKQNMIFWEGELDENCIFG